MRQFKTDHNITNHNIYTKNINEIDSIRMEVKKNLNESKNLSIKDKYF